MKLNITLYGRGKPLVLFHGWGYDQQVWAPLLSKLTHQYQLCLVDSPSFGYRGDVDWDEFKSELLARLPLQFALVGWSMGGLFATRLAIEAPDRVTHLVNVGSSPRFIQDLDWPGVERSAFITFYDNLASDPQKTLATFMGLQWPGYTTPTRIPSLTSLSAGLDVLLNWDLRESLLDLTMPVCYVFGRLDRVTPRALMQAMQKRFPNFDYHLFQQAAHVPFLSHQDQFVDVLNHFLLGSK